MRFSSSAGWAIRADRGSGIEYWAVDEDHLFAALSSTPAGLSDAEAESRSAGLPRAIGDRRVGTARLLARQFRSPIIIVLVCAALLSAALGEHVDAAIIIGIVALSGLLGFLQEHGAVRAVEALLASVRVHADALRDGAEKEVLVADVVPGDVVVLRAGDVVPGDARVITANQLLVDESALTGEAYPRRKQPGILPAMTSVPDRTNCVHLGTHVASGEGVVVVARTGTDTEFGGVVEHVARAHVPTAFERGITRFGYLLMQATGILVVGIFAINLALSRPVIDAFLFSLALAIGLTPQMLPAIVTLSLSRGAAAMSSRRVIVKRLDAIEDVGSLDVLCSDKTGTITVGTVGMDAAMDAEGRPSERVAQLARWNAQFQSGFANPIDRAIVSSVAPAGVEARCEAQVPFDFTRRRLSVAVASPEALLLVTKGSVASVLECCSSVHTERGDDDINVHIATLKSRFEQLSAGGLRVLAVASRAMDPGETVGTSSERDMVFEGFLTFADPPKEGVQSSLAQLSNLGVSVRVVTGDNRFVAARVASQVGISTSRMLVGEEIESMTDEQLALIVDDVHVFAETAPLDKERIVRAYSARGHTVGYLGDGINDAPALRVADVGVSVDTAVDVAKQTADLVLLDKSLAVLAAGIEQGRRVFSNTLKYVHVQTSANFGNMLSLAAASAFLPFLPLIPTQVLLLNFLADIPGMAVATDRVDPEEIAHPHRWDIAEVRKFMIVFGVASTMLDLCTFALLRLGYGAGPDLLRSGWFVESILTQLSAMLVLRTKRPVVRSRPATALWSTSLAVAVVGVWMPWSPAASRLGLTGLPGGMLAGLVAVSVCYVLVNESLKRMVHRSS